MVKSSPLVVLGRGKCSTWNNPRNKTHLKTSLNFDIMKYYIKDFKGIVSGFNKRFQLIQRTNASNPEHVELYGKSFKSVNAAKKWADKYVDAGYGFSTGYEIVEFDA